LALKQHKDDRVRFDQQVDNSRAYVLPFINATKPIVPGLKIFEVGCGEGGVLEPFIEKGCYCVGVDLSQQRIDLANGFLEKEVNEKKVEFLCQNIYEEDFLARFHDFFDVIILKDVIEHVPEQEKFVPYLKKFLRPGGQIFFGFPPWFMPFGGHQQILEHKWLSKLPYYHILPRFIYRGMLKMAGEDPGMIQEMMDIKDTRITIERFERIAKDSGFKILKKQHFLINPIYKYKFGLQPRKQWAPFTHLYFIRNFITTCVYYTIG
jgi:SAM-dependent methyltransferase